MSNVASPLDLLDCIAELCEDATKDLLLPVENEDGEEFAEPRAPKIFKMNVPKKEDETKQIPFILVSVQTGHDEQKPKDTPESGCGVRIVAAVFGEDDGAAKTDLLNIITRLRLSILQNRVLGGQFFLGQTVDWAIDPYEVWPYSYGELLTRYDIPPISDNNPLADIERFDEFD